MILETAGIINPETIREHLGLTGLSVWADDRLIRYATEVDTVNKCVIRYKQENGDFVVGDNGICKEAIYYTTLSLYDIETGKLLYSK